MEIVFKQAQVSDAPVISSLVVRLMQEICDRSRTADLRIDPDDTNVSCKKLLEAGHYKAFIGFVAKRPVAVSTMTETYALYAGGKIGIIQEFYVLPEYRSCGVGEKLLEAVRCHGINNGWTCVELCTPPLPEFEKTLDFYQRSGLSPVGGRKMREHLSDLC